MPTTPRGIVSPAAGDDWDLVIDLAAMAITVDNAITTGLASIPAPVPVRGSSALRDSTFGVPGNNTQRAALANQNATWFNTDFGWTESYYAVTTVAGLTVPGLVTGTASGWYPIGRGPEIHLVASASQSLSTGNTFTAWAAPGTGASWLRGTNFTINSGAVTCTMPGKYDVTGSINGQIGSGQALLALVRNNSASSGNVIDIASFALTPNFHSHQKFIKNAYAINANDNIRLYCINAGGITFGGGADGASPGNGSMSIRYSGPNLVSA